MTLSIVLTCRNETLLGQTIRRARATCGCQVEFIVVHDGPPSECDDDGKDIRQFNPWPRSCGVQAARHFGISKAAGDVIFVTDAHVDFRDGSEWGRDLMAHIAAHPQDVTCGKCWHNQSMSFDVADGYTGARFHWAVVENGVRTVLCGKWATAKTGQEISCIMGASYGFSRRWYMHGLRGPWQYGTGWGHDEETLSAVNWLCGGRNIMAGPDVAHLWRTRSPWKQTHAESAKMWANRERLIHMLPFSHTEREYLLGWLAQNQIVINLRGEIDRFVGDVSAMNAHLRNQRRTTDDWKREWVDMAATRNAAVVASREAERTTTAVRTHTSFTPTTPAPAADQFQVIQRELVQCEMCGAIDSFAYTAGPRRAGDSIVAYAKCRRCGHKAKEFRDHPALR